jgi:hypothetical protein
MSIRKTPVLICDGCGTTIGMDFYITRRPARQKVVKQDRHSSSERHFCCSACEAWWNAQFPQEGPWGPAWDEREWWCDNVGPCGERARVRTAHEESPLMDMEFHVTDPEPIS